LWLLAEWRGDITLKIKVNEIVAAIETGCGYQRRTEPYERWVARVADGGD
jgi:hypothetical protein